jgi:hypothetical protein
MSCIPYVILIIIPYLLLLLHCDIGTFFIFIYWTWQIREETFNSVAVIFLFDFLSRSSFDTFFPSEPEYLISRNVWSIKVKVPNIHDGRQEEFFLHWQARLVQRNFNEISV